MPYYLLLKGEIVVILNDVIQHQEGVVVDKRKCFLYPFIIETLCIYHFQINQYLKCIVKSRPLLMLARIIHFLSIYFSTMKVV